MKRHRLQNKYKRKMIYECSLSRTHLAPVNDLSSQSHSPWSCQRPVLSVALPLVLSRPGLLSRTHLGPVKALSTQSHSPWSCQGLVLSVALTLLLATPFPPVALTLDVSRPCPLSRTHLGPVKAWSSQSHSPCSWQRPFLQSHSPWTCQGPVLSVALTLVLSRSGLLSRTHLGPVKALSSQSHSPWSCQGLVLSVALTLDMSRPCPLSRTHLGPVKALSSQSHSPWSCQGLVLSVALTLVLSRSGPLSRTHLGPVNARSSVYRTST